MLNGIEISTVFGVGRQEDASEFFTTLLESMSKSLNFATCPLVINKHKVDHSKKRPPTILDEIFSFQFRSRGKDMKHYILLYNDYSTGWDL